jgi:phosphoserine phosphatase RsbU/P
LNRFNEVVLTYSKKLFEQVAKYTCYILPTTLFSGGIAGSLASLFAIYYFDAVKIPVSTFMMLLLKFLIVCLWIFSAFQHGLFYRLGLKGLFGKSIRMVNQYVETRPTLKIKDALTAHEYQELLKALFITPFYISSTIALMVVSLVFIMLIVGLYTNEYSLETILHIIYVGVIATFVTYSFTLVFSEMITGKHRAECMRTMNSLGIPVPDKEQMHTSTVKIKLFFFIGIFIIGLFLSNLITYFNKESLSSVWSFSAFVILVCLLMAYLIFYAIYYSLKQIEKAAYDLMNGGKGVLFLRSMDTEFLNVAQGVNKASITIIDYQQSLEKKVEQRTRELKETVDKLDATVKELNQKEAILQMELDFAANIQAGIIPSKKEMEPWNGISFAGYYQPLGKVSGDYYDIFRFPNCLFVLLTDASGHGVPAALVTMAAKQAFSTNVSSDLKPSEIYKKVNLILEDKIKTSDYLTAFMLKIDEKNRVMYSNASHTKAIHFDKQNSEYRMLDTNGMFIGAIKDAGDFYEDKTMKLQSGDRVYLYTDGLVEHKNTYGEEFGIDRLVETLSQTRERPLPEQVKLTVYKLKEFTKGTFLKDDISMIAIELESKWSKFIELYNAGIHYLRSNEFQESLRHFIEAQTIIPGFQGLLYQLALVNYQLCNYSEAEKQIRFYMDSNPNDIKAVQLAVNILMKENKKEEAKELIKIFKLGEIK